jgi:histone H3/H4
MADAPGSPTAGGVVREREGFLPVADISRVMRKAVPANGKIDKDAKEAVQDLVSKFIAFITSE